MSTQNTASLKPSSMGLLLTGLNPSTSDRDALIRAFDRLESQLERLEGQVHKVDSQFHQLMFRIVEHHGSSMKLLLDIVARVRELELRLPSSSGTLDPPQRPRRTPSKKRKAA